VQNLRELYATGELSPKLTEIYFGERPHEELYDVKDEPSQLNNLVADPTFAKELDRHRKLLDDWLAKGDAGEGEESNEELAFQSKDQKWGRAVNPEYEVVRTDSDGDGLSDAWEKINGRDPADGKLLFTFDCGGWQTEGWKGSTKLGNIAGRQGFLDFQLEDGSGVIRREGLKLDAKKNGGALALTARASADVTVQFAAKTQNSRDVSTLVSIKLPAGKDFSKVMIPMPKNEAWSGTIESIQLKLDGRPGTIVEIDAILIE
jgi:hypothetical protein